MAYTYENLISDLKSDENWNAIREKALAGKLNLKDVPEAHRAEVKSATDEYFKRKSTNAQTDKNIHCDIPHFCRDGKNKIIGQ